MRIFLVTLLLSTFCYAQQISYSPGNILEKTIATSYYNTEYLFVNYSGANAIDLNFELVSANIPQGWHVTGCTNMICYVKIPDDGTFGIVQQGTQAYMSINLAANDIVGDATIKFSIFELGKETERDTITFIYHAEEETTLSEPQPWAKINYAQNVITVFIKSDFTNTSLTVFDVRGNKILSQTTEAITAASMNNFAAGVYFVVVENKDGRRLVQKIVRE